MPARQPITLNEHHFPSRNRARQHYTAILHRYKPGEVLTEPDRADVEALMTQCDRPGWAGTRFEVIRVTKAGYGRNCFCARRADKSPQNLSIVAALRAPPQTEGDSEAVQSPQAEIAPCSQPPSA